MWIKEKPKEFGNSGKLNINFLYNSDNIYIMDNHLCAAWCWLQKIDTDKIYNLIHIDRHNDLLFPIPTIKEDLIEDNIDLQKISFLEYLSLNEKNNESFTFQLFRWDNYILSIDYIYPKLFGEKYFITKEPYPSSEFIDFECIIEEFLSDFSSWIKNSKNGCILNLDLDFFYSQNNGFYKLYSDELINKIGELIKQNLENIDVLTIALSPECCGGWESSINTLRKLNNVLGIKMKI